MKKTVGIIGLGEMGEGIARNIQKAGFPLVVYDLNPEQIKRMVDLGASPAKNLFDILKSCSWIILVLPNTDVVKDVLLGNNGIVSNLGKDHIVIDCGTTHPIDTKKFCLEVEKRKAHFLDAPVSGMKARAYSGSLTIMVGGNEFAFNKVIPVLESFGSKINYMGKSGSGQLMKALNNVLFNISIAAMSEILPLSVKLGLSPEIVSEVVSTASGQSFGFDKFSELAISRNFQDGYSMESARKDMDTVLEFANVLQTSLPLVNATMQTYEEAIRKGYGSENKASMIKIWEEKLDVLVKSAVD